MTLLDNRYQVTRELGEGAFGKTFIAVDTRSPTRRQCVVKQLKLVATEAQNHFYQSLFEREALVLEQIGQRAGGRIPNLLAYFTEEGDHYFVMELVTGKALANRIAESGRQDEATVRGWLGQILETLDFLHRVEYADAGGKRFRGVIHRDIKPGNIIIREGDGSPVLIDFGVVKEIAARSTIRNDGTLTKTAGTPYFMPPEQQNGHPVPASDLYALGVTAMVALTGKPPNEFYDPGDLSFEWRKYAPETSSELAEALDRATRARAKERFQSAREMLEGLSARVIRPALTRPVLPEPPSLPRTVAAPEPPSVKELVSELEKRQKERRSVSRNRLILAGVGLLLAILGSGGLGTWYAVSNSRKIEKSLQLPSKEPQAEFKPVAVTWKIGDSMKLPSGIEVMYVPGGKFEMGSEIGDPDEKPVHLVTIEPFWMGKFEITQAQWESVMGNNPSYFKNCPTCPVEDVSWDDCQEFIRRLNAKDDGNTYRLPTEEEWEYACRSGSTGLFAGNLDDLGWYDKNSRKQTHEVGQKQANNWGLYDMHGNVWEWCQDFQKGYPGKKGTDAMKPMTDSYRVHRGGSWDYSAEYCRSANRGGYLPATGFYNVGLRIVRIHK